MLFPPFQLRPEYQYLQRNAEIYQLRVTQYQGYGAISVHLPLPNSKTGIIKNTSTHLCIH